MKHAHIKAVIACGGTGGHITPALAIADVLKGMDSGCELLFAGADGGMETRLVPEAGYPLETLKIMGLRRSLSPVNVKVLYLTARALARAKRILSDFCPDIVIGTGGYVCYPMLRAAISAGIPTAVHESNAVPGLAVRRLARGIDRIWLNFEVSASALPQEKCLVVGNPLRAGFCAASPAPLPHGCRRMLLSFGGSLGAEALNRAALSLMEGISAHPDIFYMHATGRGAYESWYAEFATRGLAKHKNLCPMPFISDMPRRLAAADVVIARAGAMTVSELAAAGKCAILVPSPNVTGDHQRKNAALLAMAGAARVVEESALGDLPSLALSLLGDGVGRAELARKIRSFQRPDCNVRIAEDIRRLLR